MRFSALLFPIVAPGDFGFLSCCPSADLFSGDNKPGLYYCQRNRAPANGLVRVLTLSLENRTALVQDNGTLDLQPSRFRYYGFYSSPNLTACIWLNFADFDSSFTWVREWSGG